MNQASHGEGPYDPEWYGDDQQLPPSLGVWPLGRTYVHPSDGALSTGPAGAAGGTGHDGPARSEGAVRRGPAGNGRGGPGAGGRGGRMPASGGRPGPRPLEGGQRDDWQAGGSFDGSEHIAVPPFTGTPGHGSTPLYERLALYERVTPPPDPGAPRGGRPPLYQVGGKYRGDDWPTDPGFRRGDLGLDDGATDHRLGGADPGFGALDPGSTHPGRGAGFGPDPGYGDYRHDAGVGRHGAARPDGGAVPDPGPYSAPGAGPAGRGAGSGRRGGPHPAPPPAAAASGIPPVAPERPRRDAEQVAPIRPGAAGGQASGRQGPQTWERNVTPAARVAAVEDAKLLAFLHELVQRLKNVPSLYPRLVFLVVGYAAITSLAAAYAEKVPLPITASLIVIPAAGIIFSMGMRYPDWGRRALTGWIAGIIATIVYDMLRLALVKVGIWGDPIPGIGRLVLADPHANFAWGYFWRFTGNGGGMGIAYTMLPWRGVRTGIAYGTLICTGLVALLFFFPVAQVHFFPLTPVTTVGAYAGHWVYGAVLGKITSWWLPPVELGRIHGRLTARLIHPGHRPRPSHLRGPAEHEDGARRATARRSA
jgi:hypothetical protein